MGAQCSHCILRHVLHLGLGDVVDVAVVLVELAQNFADLQWVHIHDRFGDIAEQFVFIPVLVAGQQTPCH